MQLGADDLVGLRDRAWEGDALALQLLEREMARRGMDRPPGYPTHLIEEARARADRKRWACPPEEVEQRAVVAFLEGLTLKGVLRREDWWHTPNGGARNRAVAGKLKAEGVHPGVADIIIARPVCVGGWRAPGLALELKRAERSRSKVSAAQREWLARRRLMGWIAEVCYGAVEAVEMIMLVWVV